MPRPPIDPALHSRRKLADRFATPVIAKSGADVPALLPAPPASLPDGARRHWESLGRQLMATGFADAPGKYELLRMAALVAYHIDIAGDPLDTRLIATQRGVLKDLFERPKGEFEKGPAPPSPWDVFSGNA